MSTIYTVAICIQALQEQALECPECKTQDSLVLAEQDFLDNQNTLRTRYCVYCKLCKFLGPLGTTIPFAIWRWNQYEKDHSPTTNITGSLRILSEYK